MLQTLWSCIHLIMLRGVTSVPPSPQFSIPPRPFFLLLIRWIHAPITPIDKEVMSARAYPHCPICPNCGPLNQKICQSSSTRTYIRWLESMILISNIWGCLNLIWRMRAISKRCNTVQQNWSCFAAYFITAELGLWNEKWGQARTNGFKLIILGFWSQ